MMKKFTLTTLLLLLTVIAGVAQSRNINLTIGITGPAIRLCLMRR